ncbi:girdin-like isoform X3 [Mytilus trossulus]|uniref:girdin-like isoform X3 n=1 Tax=Mytilus trossulus TaxID=6551 RepID=UPI003005333B
MTVNTQRLTTLQQSLENLLTEKRTLNSKVISDSYNHFKNCISKTKAGQANDLKPSLKRLEQSLKNEGAYKNVKAKFELIKADILDVVDHTCTMKAIKRDTQNPQRLDKKIEDKSGNRARTVTLQHAQDRQKAKGHGLPVAPAIKRPVIQSDQATYKNSHKTPDIEVNGRGNSGSASSEELLGLNKTITRLFDQLDIDKTKHGQNIPQSDTSKQTAKTTKPQTKTSHKLPKGEELKDVRTLVAKLKIFEDEFHKRKLTQEEYLQSLQVEVERLQSALGKKEQELDRLRSTHSIAQRAKGKTVEKMAEIHEHEKRDMVVKLQTLELNIKKNMEVDNNDLQVWKASFADISSEVDSLWKDVYSNRNFPDVRHVSKTTDSDSPRSKSAPIKAKIATAKALLVSNSKRLEEAERKLSEGVGSSNGSDVLKKVAEELNKLQTDYRPSNSRLSLRSISTNKSEELPETTEITHSVKNIRKLMQDFESRITEYEKTIKEHDNDMEVLRHRIVKLGAGVLNDDNIHETDSAVNGKIKNVHVLSEKLNTMIKKLEIFDERLKQLQEQNKIYKRQLEGKDSNSHRLAVIETDLHELCNILRVPDIEKQTDSSGDKLKAQIRLCKNVSRKLTDEKENIERKLAKAIMDVSDVTKHVSTLYHHIRKIRHVTGEGWKSDPNIIQTAIEEAQQKLNDVTQNIDQMSMEKDDYKRKYKTSADDLTRVAHTIHLLRLEIEGRKIEEENSKSVDYNYTADIEAVKQNLWKAVGEKRAYIDTIDEKSSQISDLKEQITKLQIQVTVRENEIKEKTHELQRFKDTGGEISKENKQLQDNIESTSREKRQLEKETENLKSTIEKTSKELKETQDEKSNLLRRLSKAMGNNLSDGNPTVANLSDPFRPEKMAEKFSQLYDDEWTSAFEVLTSMFSMDEKMAADCLLNVAKESYHFCLRLAEGQLKDVTRILLMIHRDGVNEMANPEKTHSLSKDDNRQIKDVRKVLAKYSAATVIGLYQTSEGKSYITEEQIEQCEQFVHKCVELCWLMAVNDPPVHMFSDMKSGESIDTTYFRHFTSSGDYVEYVVWPALLISKKGPVISKGVVQAI